MEKSCFKNTVRLYDYSLYGGLGSKMFINILINTV